MTAIGNVLGVAQKAQDLQSGQLLIQRQQAELPAVQAQAGLTQNKISQQQAFAKQFQTGVDEQGNSLKGAGGEMDPAKVIAMQGRLAPLVPEIGKSIMDTHTAKVGLQAASQNLDALQRTELMGPIQAIATNPNDPSMVGKASDAIDAWATAHPEMGALAKNAKVLLSHIQNAQTPQDRTHLASSMAALLQPGQAVQTQPQGASVNTGGAVQQGTTAPPVAGGGFTPQTSITNTLPPGERENVSINPVTRSPMTTTKDAAGHVTGVTQTPTGAGVPQLAPGDAEAIPQLADMRTRVNAAAQKVGENHFNNAQIIKLADETNTGTQAGLLRSLKGGYAGAPWTADAATNFDRLGHFLALETQANASTMGAGTDAARHVSEQATASTGWTADAIKSAAKINDALATGVGAFNQGMEKSIANAGGNVLAARKFQNTWSQSFDPDVYRYENALKAKDGAEVTKILGPAGSPQRAQKAAELLQKRVTLNNLATQGVQ